MISDSQLVPRLTPSAKSIYIYLLRHEGQVVSHEELQQRYYICYDTVVGYIQQIRKTGVNVKAVWGKGYKLIGDKQ